jgi:tetratricopeptide (TPR) repeat protein
LRPIDLTGRVQLARAYQLQDSLDIAREKYQQILTIIDSLLAADSSQAIKDKYVPTIIAVHYILAQMDYKQKEFLSAVSNMEKAISFESKDIKKKDDNLHLFLAQMYNVARSVKTLDPVVAREIRQKAVAEYRFVLKINPKNATAKKELGQLEGN